MEFEETTEKIIKCAMDVHTALGPGLLESAYKECLYYKLHKIGLYVETELALIVGTGWICWLKILSLLS
jgi:GxxExxY protein